MLGYVMADGPGVADRVLAQVADLLRAADLRLAGAVQVNEDRADAGPCHMDLHILTHGAVVRISQNLGPMSKGCRLDSAGLEAAVGLVAADIAADPAPQVLLVNKFGKREADGRGFRPVIATALGRDIPVIVALHANILPAFATFADGMGAALPPDPAAIVAWVLDQTA